MNNQLSLIKDTYYFGLKTGSCNGFIIGFVSGFCINKIFNYVYKMYQKWLNLIKWVIKHMEQ